MIVRCAQAYANQAVSLTVTDSLGAQGSDTKRSRTAATPNNRAATCGQARGDLSLRVDPMNPLTFWTVDPELNPGKGGTQ